MLADAGLSAQLRAEAALAIAAEYDLRQLRPGVEVTVVTETDGTLRRLALYVEDGVMIEAVFGDAPATRVRRPNPDIVTLAGVARGTPVHATAPGRIAYVGWRAGYGRTVEIAHDSDTVTRYVHLSDVPEGLATGQRIAAGDVIGNVNATGTATGPNLHYEVRVDGRPTDPVSDHRLAAAAEAKTQVEDAKALLETVRARLADHLADTSVSATGRS